MGGATQIVRENYIYILFYLVDCCRGMFRGTCSLRSVPWLNNDDTTYLRGTTVKGMKHVCNNWEMYRFLCVL